MSYSIENKDLFNSSNLSTKFGLIVGLLMSFFLLAFQISGNDYSPYLKLVNYVLFSLVIILALNLFKNRVKGDIFIKGIALGTKLSFIAGLTIVAVNVILFFFFKDLTFSKYALVPTSTGQLALVSVLIFFETLVFGSLLSFIVLQFLKEKPNI